MAHAASTAGTDALSPFSRTTVEPTPRWVRVKLDGAVIADSRRALLVLQYGPNGLPTYYFPPEDVRIDALVPPAKPRPDDVLDYRSVRVGNHVAEHTAWIYLAPPPDLAALRGYVSFAWNDALAWYEEEEQVFVHARDPHKRVDVLASSRHVQVGIGGEIVADTRRPYLLFETWLPTRYYLPRDDVRMDLLEPSGLTTRCPYKGLATYWSVRLGEATERNVVWSYAEPIPECPKIKGLLCFFNERVDLTVDGVMQPRPRTPWSR